MGPSVPSCLASCAGSPHAYHTLPSTRSSRTHTARIEASFVFRMWQDLRVGEASETLLLTRPQDAEMCWP